MDKAEFAVIAAALRTYYPRHNLLPNAEAMELWYRDLNDIPAEVLTAALRKWAVTETWPPSLAELRKACGEIVNGPAPDWGDGWSNVMRAVGRYGVHREAEALASLPEMARAAVRRIGWRDICLSDNPETLRAQFRQVYEIVTKRETENRNLPPALREMIGALCLTGNEQAALPEGRT